MKRLFGLKIQKKKEIFRKWAVFPHFLCRLHRNRTKNVGNAPLAEPAFFSYTFNRKVKEQQRHRLCPGAGLGEGECLQIFGSCCSSTRMT